VEKGESRGKKILIRKKKVPREFFAGEIAATGGRVRTSNLEKVHGKTKKKKKGWKGKCLGGSIPGEKVQKNYSKKKKPGKKCA